MMRRQNERIWGTSEWQEEWQVIQCSQKDDSAWVQLLEDSSTWQWEATKWALLFPQRNQLRAVRGAAAKLIHGTWSQPQPVDFPQGHQREPLTECHCSLTEPVLQATSVSCPQGQDDRVGGVWGLWESTCVTAAAFPCQRGHGVTWKDPHNLHCSYFLQ